MPDYCPDCDPLLNVPGYTCNGCGSQAWPVDATWLDEGTILARYTQDHTPGCRSCIGRDFTVILTNPKGLLPIPPARNAARARKHYREQGHYPGTGRCTATTVAGRQCLNAATAGGLCMVHIWQRRRESGTV